MKNPLFFLLLLILFSCDNKPVKSQNEILTETTKATVLKAFNAQMAGEIDYAVKYTLNETGKIVEQKEYLSDLLLAQRLYGQDLCGEKKTIE